MVFVGGQFAGGVVVVEGEAPVAVRDASAPVVDPAVALSQFVEFVFFRLFARFAPAEGFPVEGVCLFAGAAVVDELEVPWAGGAFV